MMRKLLVLSISLILVSCSSGKKINDLIDSGFKEPDRKTIDTDRLGTNAFVNDPRFGSISQQFHQVRDTFGLKRVRVLFAWDDNVQPTPDGKINFGFDDSIIAGLPANMGALIVVTGIPSWMNNPDNWTSGNPRATFIQRWFRKVAARYGSDSRVLGFEVWNEPNQVSNPQNDTMGFISNPENFVDMMGMARVVLNEEAPNKILLNGATTAIAQGYPETLDYNSAMVADGLLEFVDVFAIHVYGKQYEKYDLDIFDFLKGVTRPIWVTESGAQGVNSQLEYAERTWPFLMDHVPQIEWIFQYQFAEATPADTTYGLLNLTAGSELSDLAVYLRDRN